MRSLPRNAVARLALVVGMSVSAGADASVQRITEGQPISLKSDQGLLVLAIDSDGYFEYADVESAGSGLGGEKVKSIGPGRTQYVFVVTAGTYRWGRWGIGSSVGTSSSQRTYFDLHGDTDFRCAASAGNVTYCGDTVVRFRGYRSLQATFKLRNRSALAIDRFDSAFPGVRRRFDWNYVGEYPDPFPNYLAQLEAAVSGRSPAKQPMLPAAPPVSAGAPTIKDFFRAERVREVRISPDGSLLVEVGYESNEHVVRAIDVNGGQAVTLYRGTEAPVEVEWSGDRSVLLGFPAPDGQQHLVAVDLELVSGNVPKFTAKALPKTGYVVDAMPSDGRYALIGRYDIANEDRLGVFRVRIGGSKISRLDYNFPDRLDKGLEGDFAWIASGGELRLAMVDHDGRTEVLHRANGEFRSLTTLSDDEYFAPVSIEEDGSSILVITNRGREYRELVRFDVTSRKITETVAAVPGNDIHAAIRRSADRAVVGVRYYESGRLRSHYFDAGLTKVQRSLERAFPERNIVVVDQDRTGSRSVLLVESASLPAAYYLFEHNARRVELLAQVHPELEGFKFASPEVLSVAASGGVTLDAFLFLPGKADAVPLVVMPHGGPIGIFDVQHFDSEVQFLVSRGYGVLQVNYRGSGGQGRTLLKLGERNFGREIEADVLAAIDTAIARGSIDGSRVALVGSSYGGYSGMRSAMRWPDRFRAVVSIAGTTDIPLQFTGSDAAGDPETLAVLARWIGDPRVELPLLRELSPVYRPEQLSVPLLLIHGTDDVRVPYEHARRLTRVLSALGKPPVLVTLEGEEHGFRMLDSWVTTYSSIEAFLWSALRAESASASPAPTPGQ